MEASSATEHSKDSHGEFNWLHPKMLPKLHNIHECKIRESLEISNLEAKAEYNKSIEVLDKDQGDVINTNSRMPFFININRVHHANAIK